MGRYVNVGLTFRPIGGLRPRRAALVCFNSDPVPKMKTHSGAKKRFRKTATGKLRGRRAYSSHILEKKSPKRKRRMARPVEIAPSDVKTVRNLLGGGK
jgi:large subunit ribosomal protein L35